MATLPANVSLANIADGANIVASDHRNNYSSVQAYINALNAILAAGAPGQVLGSSGGTTIGWQNAAVTYRKTTAKAVNTTVAATDLLNGEITVAANAMGATGCVRLTAWGDWLQNSGGTAAPPRFQVVFGGTTFLDTGSAGAGACSAAAGRFPWRLVVEILNTATNAQQVTISGRVGNNAAVTWGTTFTTGNGIYDCYLANAQAMGFIEGVNNTGLAVDTTASKALALNVVNGSASASYETKLFGALVEVV